jgi:predicted  nucleic acid-binding Zn-ribbon protein
MVKSHSNIKQFNKHINTLLANLLKGCKSCGDRVFVDYVSRLEDRIDDGKTIDSVTLMSWCLTKYLMKVQRNAWQAPTAEDEKIVALQAQVEGLKVMAATANANARKEDTQGGRAPQRPKKEREPWMKVPPKEEEPGTKTMKGAEYKWCDKHVWCKHATPDCRNINFTPTQPAANEPGNGEAPRLAVDSTLQALVEDEESDSY